MGMGFPPTWLRQVSPRPASRDHFNHCLNLKCIEYHSVARYYVHCCKGRSAKSMEEGHFRAPGAPKPLNRYYLTLIINW